MRKLLHTHSVLIIIYIYLFVSHSLLHMDAQPFAAWIVDQMVSASRENVDVIQASLEIYVINCHAIPAVPSMDNVRTERACARKVGMDVIAHCVSISYTLAPTYFFSAFFFVFRISYSFHFPSEEFGHKETGTKSKAQLQNYTNEMSWISFFLMSSNVWNSVSGDPSMRPSKSTRRTIWCQIVGSTRQTPRTKFRFREQNKIQNFASTYRTDCGTGKYIPFGGWRKALAFLAVDTHEITLAIGRNVYSKFHAKSSCHRHRSVPVTDAPHSTNISFALPLGTSHNHIRIRIHFDVFCFSNFNGFSIPCALHFYVTVFRCNI